MISRNKAAQQSRVERYAEILRSVARELKVKPGSETAIHVATMRMARELAHTRMLERGDIDIAALAKIDEIIGRYIPVEQKQFKIEIVNPKSKDVVCPHCRAEFDPYGDEAEKVKRPPPSAAPSKPSLAAVCDGSWAAEIGKQAHREILAANNVVPIKPEPLPDVADPISPLSMHQPPSSEGRSIHSAVSPDGSRPPLKRLQDHQSWRNTDPADDPRRSSLAPAATSNPPQHPLPFPVIPT
jgi:hypothetical protein